MIDLYHSRTGSAIPTGRWRRLCYVAWQSICPHILLRNVLDQTSRRFDAVLAGNPMYALPSIPRSSLVSTLPYSIPFSSMREGGQSGEAETNLSSPSFLHPQNRRNYMKASEPFSNDAHQVLGLGRGSSLRCTTSGHGCTSSSKTEIAKWPMAYGARYHAASETCKPEVHSEWLILNHCHTPHRNIPQATPNAGLVPAQRNSYLGKAIHKVSELKICLPRNQTDH
jgi:hypothetical protein